MGSEFELFLEPAACFAIMSGLPQRKVKTASPSGILFLRNGLTAGLLIVNCYYVSSGQEASVGLTFSLWAKHCRNPWKQSDINAPSAADAKWDGDPICIPISTAVHETSKRLSQTLQDVYEADWDGVEDLGVIIGVFSWFWFSWIIWSDSGKWQPRKSTVLNYSTVFFYLWVFPALSAYFVAWPWALKRKDWVQSITRPWNEHRIACLKFPILSSILIFLCPSLK